MPVATKTTHWAPACLSLVFVGEVKILGGGGRLLTGEKVYFDSQSYVISYHSGEAAPGA